MSDDNLNSRPVQGEVSTPSSKDRLRERIEKLGISQRAAARLIGVGEREMREWCAGKAEPPAFALNALDFGARRRKIQEEEIAEHDARIAREEAVIARREAHAAKLGSQVRFLENPDVSIGFGPAGGTRDAALMEASRLRMQLGAYRLRVEELRVMLEWDDAWQRKQAVTFKLFNHFDMDHGGDGLPPRELIQESEDAEAAFDVVEAKVKCITLEIQRGNR